MQRLVNDSLCLLAQQEAGEAKLFELIGRLFAVVLFAAIVASVARKWMRKK